MGEKRGFVSKYSSLLLDNRKCEKVDNGDYSKKKVQEEIPIRSILKVLTHLKTSL